jgi:hypothetical protein
VSRAGGCACRAVRYVVDGPLRDILVCHCADCVEAVGSPWAATAVHRRDLSLRHGEALRWRRAPDSEHRASRGGCERCGTVVFWDAPDRDTVSLGAATLDDPPPLVVAGHIWVAQDPGWEPVDDVRARAPLYPRGVPDGPEAPTLRWVT